MSRLLQSVAPDAIHCLGQLFEYYLYAVFSFFTADPPVSISWDHTFILQGDHFLVLSIEPGRRKVSLYESISVWFRTDDLNTSA